MYRWLDKLYLAPNRENKFRAWYQNELGPLMDKHPEFFRAAPIEELKRFYSELTKRD